MTPEQLILRATDSLSDATNLLEKQGIESLTTQERILIKIWFRHLAEDMHTIAMLWDEWEAHQHE